MKSINNWTDNIYLDGDDDADNIDNSAENVTISSNAGNDTIRNWATKLLLKI